jgi:hypothetical protein
MLWRDEIIIFENVIIRFACIQYTIKKRHVNLTAEALNIRPNSARDGGEEACKLDLCILKFRRYRRREEV